ncbi:MAG: hypothetical protein HQM14_15265 [SAR324 cluster bacterium]|nr:hypothetical protein [SAR324 cluster bacterium]
MANLIDESIKIIRLADLTPGEQAMVAKGIIAIILADGVVTTSELQYLKRHCRVFLEDDSVITIDRLKEYIANKEKPEFWYLNISESAKVHYMLKVFVKAIYADRQKAQSEIDVYFNIGKLMGISFYVLSEVLKIESDKILLQERENRMLEDLKILLKRNIK